MEEEILEMGGSPSSKKGSSEMLLRSNPYMSG